MEKTKDKNNEQQKNIDDNDQNQVQRKHGQIYDYTTAKLIKVQFKDECEQVKQYDLAEKHFEQQQNNYMDLLDEIKINTMEKKEELQRQKGILEKIKFYEFDQFDKTNPLQYINNNNNFRVYGNEKIEMAHLKQKLEEKRRVLLETEMKLFEAGQFTSSLTLMQHRILTQREQIRQKVVELDELQQMAQKKVTNVYNEVTDVYTQKSLLKFQFKNIVHLMDNLAKIQDTIRKRKQKYAKQYEKDMYSELLQYARYKNLYQETYDELQQQILFLKEIEFENKQKKNKQRDGNYLVSYLDDFDTIYDAFIANNTNDYIENLFNSLEEPDKESSLNKIKENIESNNNDLKRGSLLQKDSLQASTTIQQSKFSNNNNQNQNLSVFSNNQKKRNSFQNSNAFSPRKSKILRENKFGSPLVPKKENVKLVPMNNIQKRMSTSPLNLLNRNSIQNKLINTQQQQQLNNYKQNNDKKQGDLQSQVTVIKVEDQLIEKSQKLLQKNKNKTKQSMVDQLNTFFAKHNHDINSLFEKFSYIFNYFIHSIDTLRDQVFQLEMDKQKNQNYLEKLNQEFQEYLNADQIELFAFGKKDYENPQITFNELVFQTNIKEANVTNFDQKFESKHLVDNKNFAFQIIISINHMVVKFNKILRSLVELSEKKVPQELAKLLATSIPFLNSLGLANKQLEEKNSENHLQQEIDNNEFPNLQTIIELPTNLDQLRQGGTFILSEIFQELFQDLHQSHNLFYNFIKNDPIISKFTQQKTVLEYLNTIYQHYQERKNFNEQIDSNTLLKQIMYQNLEILYTNGRYNQQIIVQKALEQVKHYFQVIFKYLNEGIKSIDPKIIKRVPSIENIAPMQTKPYQSYINRKYNQIKERQGLFSEERYFSNQCYDIYCNVTQKIPEKVNILNIVKIEVEKLKQGQGNNMEEVFYVEKQRKIIKTKLDRLSKSVEPIVRKPQPQHEIKKEINDSSSSDEDSINLKTETQQNTNFKQVKMEKINQNTNLNNSHNIISSQPLIKSKKDKVVYTNHLQGIKSQQKEFAHWNKIIHYDELFRSVKKNAYKEIENQKSKKLIDLNQIQMFDKGRKKKHFISIMKKKKRVQDKEIQDKQQKLIAQLQEVIGSDEETKNQMDHIFSRGLVKVPEKKKKVDTNKKQKNQNQNQQNSNIKIPEPILNLTTKRDFHLMQDQKNLSQIKENNKEDLDKSKNTQQKDDEEDDDEYDDEDEDDEEEDYDRQNEQSVNNQKILENSINNNKNQNKVKIVQYSKQEQNNSNSIKSIGDIDQQSPSRKKQQEIVSPSNTLKNSNNFSTLYNNRNNYSPGSTQPQNEAWLPQIGNKTPLAKTTDKFFKGSPKINKQQYQKSPPKTAKNNFRKIQ